MIIIPQQNNLIFTQDANQAIVNSNLFTFRNYDGVNRLTGTGEAVIQEDSPNDETQYQPSTPTDYLIVNVYDTLSSSVVTGLFNPPSDYYSATFNNFTKGNLVSTAYRTRKTDNWSFKYYRYDERGRVKRMWTIIDGLAEKNIQYDYNSQDQVTKVYYGYETEHKRYTYSYDYAGRLSNLDFANEEPSLNQAAPDINFTNYTYNKNSLIDYQHFNSYQIENNFQYNSRNWLTTFDNSLGQFSFTNTYEKNGNLKTQLIYGTYKDYMQNKYNLNYNYSYDNSNRLLTAQNTNQGDNTYSTFNTYDKDGNILTLRRYGDNNVLTDDFNYLYYPGTNKLRRVSGTEDQYNYDLNGNTIRDTVNYNFNIKYDYRNLITELYHKDPASVSRPNTYANRYYYDESGNRIRKLVYFTSQANPPPVIDWNNPGNGWALLNNEFYVKGVDGKDLATYKGNVLDEWFVWGNDLTGKIKGDKQYYYYKDHLGSVRVVVDNTSVIVAGYDYDAWGYPLENRNYNGDSIKYKYTGKELDKESFYDYFGARYYDSRIGRWGQVEPLFEKYFSYSPYSYSILNPLKFKDVNGKDAIAEVDEKNKRINITLIFNYSRFNRENQRGINATQYKALLEFQQNIQELWSGNFEINGVDYEVSTIVQLIAFGNFEDAATATQENMGQNIVLNAQDNDIIEGNIGVGSDASALFLRKGKYLNPRWDTGGHEAGHLLGLPDITSKGNKSIMSYALDRQAPGSSEVNRVINISNLNLSITGPQVIGGYQR